MSKLQTIIKDKQKENTSLMLTYILIFFFVAIGVTGLYYNFKSLLNTGEVYGDIELYQSCDGSGDPHLCRAAVGLALASLLNNHAINLLFYFMLCMSGLVLWFCSMTFEVKK